MLSIHAQICMKHYQRPERRSDIKTALPEHILKLCAISSGMPESYLISKERTKELVIIRHIYCYIANSFAKISLKKIAKCIDRDHTTVIHARDKVINYLNSGENDYITALNKIIERLNVEYEIPLLNDKGGPD